MSIQMYNFHELGSIPGVPGQFPAGTRILLDTQTGTITDMRPVAATLAAIREDEPALILSEIGTAEVGKPEQLPVQGASIVLGPLIEGPNQPSSQTITPIEETI